MFTQIPIYAACVSSLLFIFVFGTSLAHADTPTHIDEVFVIFEDETHGGVDTITILGRSLNPKDLGLPEVALGTYDALQVIDTTDVEIVALCPQNEANSNTPTCVEGDYRLTVTTGSGNQDTDSYDLTVNARPTSGTGILGREVVRKNSPINSSYKCLVIECPANMVTISGGGRILFEPGSGYAGQAFTNSYPSGESEWTICASETTPTTNNWQLAGYTVCMKMEMNGCVWIPDSNHPGCQGWDPGDPNPYPPDFDPDVDPPLPGWEFCEPICSD